MYLLVGFIVAGFIIARGMKLRRPPTGGLFWEKKDHARNLFLVQGAVFTSTIGVFIWIDFGHFCFFICGRLTKMMSTEHLTSR